MEMEASIMEMEALIMEMEALIMEMEALIMEMEASIMEMEASTMVMEDITMVEMEAGTMVSVTVAVQIPRMEVVADQTQMEMDGTMGIIMVVQIPVNKIKM